MPRRDDTVAVNPLHCCFTLLCSEAKRFNIDALPCFDFATVCKSALGELRGASAERAVTIEHEHCAFLTYGSCHSNSMHPPTLKGTINLFIFAAPTQ